MSVYAMILTGLMIGIGPEKVSDEMEQGLDLSGKWEGIRRRGEAVHRFFIDGGEAWAEPLVLRRKVMIVRLDFTIVDEGKGHFRWQWEHSDSTCLGIYKWQKDRLILCLAESGRGRPTSFEVRDGQILLILHRVTENGAGKALLLQE